MVSLQIVGSIKVANTVSARSTVLCKSQRGFSKAKQIVKNV